MRPRFLLMSLAFTLTWSVPSSGAPPTVIPTPKSQGVRCVGAVQFPISARAVLVDPIGRGRNLRARVIVESQVDLERAEVRLVRTGGAVLHGATRSGLGHVAPGKPVQTDFTIALPAAGKRFYLEFQVVGQGPNGPLARGVALNLLPDGPADPGLVVTDPATGKRMREFAARRIDR